MRLHELCAFEQVNGDRSKAATKATTNGHQRRLNVSSKVDEGQPCGVAASPGDSVSAVSARARACTIKECVQINVKQHELVAGGTSMTSAT